MQPSGCIFCIMLTMEYRLVYITCKSKKEAQSIGRSVVEERLAACANIINGSNAIYRWGGEIKESNEAMLLLKTTAVRVPELIEQVKKLHSYDCPCITVLPIVAGNEEYLQWVQDSC